MDEKTSNPKVTAFVLGLTLAVILASRYPHQIKSFSEKVVSDLKSFNAEALMANPSAAPDRGSASVFEIMPGTRIFFSEPTADNPPLENSFIVPPLSLKSSVENTSAIFRPLIESFK